MVFLIPLRSCSTLEIISEVSLFKENKAFGKFYFQIIMKRKLRKQSNFRKVKWDKSKYGEISQSVK